MSARLPRLRNVEAFPVEHEGRRVVALRDPSGYAPSVVMLPGPLLEIVSLFDGEHTAADVQTVVMQRHGRSITPEDIASVVASLDEHGFLDTPRFAERRAEIEDAFLRAPTRPASHAGGAYAGDPAELRRAIDGFFTAANGPGPVTPTAARGDVRGVIAPHIDLHRGGAGYAWAYRDFGERCDADLFVIFGTSHAGLAEPFALTRKDYETPLGAARADRDFIDAVAGKATHDCFAAEASHRMEHSIEFQAVLLRYLFGERRDFTIVPVLASFAHEAMARGRRAEDDPKVARFLDAIADTAAASSRRVAYVAGADLAHMGPRFGDPEPISPDELALIERDDRAMLRLVTDGDPRGFFASIEADGDRRRICGFSPIYALLRCLGQTRGLVTHYGQWPDPDAVVTHASVVFT